VKWKPKFSTEEIGKLAQVWVTGVGGTALVIVIQSIGEDYANWQGTLSPDWGFMLDRTIRYAFALWFGIYMVLAYLANEARSVETWAGLIFDVIQSVFVFVALGLLGFVTQDFELFDGQLRVPLPVAFGAILLIGGWTFFSHLKEPKHEAKKKVWDKFQAPLQWVRCGVAIVSAAAFVYVLWRHPEPSIEEDGWALLGVLGFVIACLFGLYLYAVRAFQNDSVRSEPNKQNGVNLQSAIAALNVAGEKLETAGASLKALQVQTQP
jgi:hypothetical protein